MSFSSKPFRPFAAWKDSTPSTPFVPSEMTTALPLPWRISSARAVTRRSPARSAPSPLINESWDTDGVDAGHVDEIEPERIRHVCAPLQGSLDHLRDDPLGGQERQVSLGSREPGP